MDVLYEESAVSKNAAKAEKKYKVINVFSWISLILGLIFVMILLPNLIASFSKAQPTGGHFGGGYSESDRSARRYGVHVGNAGRIFRVALVFSLFA